MSEAARLLRRHTPARGIRPGYKLTPFHQRVLAETLTLEGGEGKKRVTRALTTARVDLNPHQVEAATFALDALTRGGGMLADEVGLGKTIEAGIVVAQLWAEEKKRILILTPATLRAQWQGELKDKFDLDAVVIDGRTRAGGGTFDWPAPVIASHQFAAGRPEELSRIPWDLVVIDEAHRLRNAHKPGNKLARALRDALAGRPKLLLTATPLQNNLSELFGLLSFLDESILGPEDAFRAQYADGANRESMSESATHSLKERLAPVVQRTLRRQVKEYVRFTQRRSVVEDFAPSADEQALYEDVSEYLRRSEATSMNPGQRTLLTMLYRKLLASSSFAIAPTLAHLADTLEKRLKASSATDQARLLLDRELTELGAEAEEWVDEDDTKPTTAALARELKELRSYADRAANIRTNAKGEALRRALDRIFTVARAHQWPEKAVVFTESKRTQTYLFNLLEANGFKGKVACLSGDAATPESRRELVEQFRDRASILLSTDAGAEGLNLQFCNLVVNYDLPWNPQRVEQRIGRCHRYGQARDVLVLNFLNRQNAADARLYELMEKKLNLFDGVFGASDEILGALESGVDFERRILRIYQQCRKPEDIDRAFSELRSDLEQNIDSRMTETRSILLERFDGDVRRRLKLVGDTLPDVVTKQADAAEALSREILGLHASKRDATKAAKMVKERLGQNVTFLHLDGTELPENLRHLKGQAGWWFTYRFDVGGLFPSQRVRHVVLVREGERFKALSPEDGPLLFELTATEAPELLPATVSVASDQEAALQKSTDLLQREAEAEALAALDTAREKADRYAEDRLLTASRQANAAHLAWEDARAALRKTDNGKERATARLQVERSEREWRRRVQALRQLEDRVFAEKDKAWAVLTQRAKVTLSRAAVATAYFQIR